MRQSAWWLGAEQASGQQGVHIAPAISDNENENLALQDAIDDPIRLEVHFPERPVPQRKKLSRVIATMGKRRKG